MNSFDDREHRRAKRRRAAKLKRTCRPWIYAPCRLYHYVMLYVRRYRRRHPYCREVRQSEADRWLERYTDWWNRMQQLAKLVMILLMYFIALALLIFCSSDYTCLELMDSICIVFGYQSFDHLLYVIGL
ncbi:unnamed protein product [Lymnaea stagnalis]|uniref:Uncharacterized protein n=1 Tax=Lymnaea stagnalis TaxID=6523 RepID=A0AAV2IQJ5_LYMST